MKVLQHINFFLLSLTSVLAVLSIIDVSFIIGTMLSLLILGAYQGFTGIILFLSHPSKIQNILYLCGLLSVFLLGCLNIGWLWMIPPIPLALYFTFLLYAKKQRINL